eukprot:Opistho-1_new@1226
MSRATPATPGGKEVEFASAISELDAPRASFISRRMAANSSATRLLVPARRSAIPRRSNREGATASVPASAGSGETCTPGRIATELSSTCSQCWEAGVSSESPSGANADAATGRLSRKFASSARPGMRLGRNISICTSAGVRRGTSLSSSAGEVAATTNGCSGGAFRFGGGCEESPESAFRFRGRDGERASSARGLAGMRASGEAGCVLGGTMGVMDCSTGTTLSSLRNTTSARLGTEMGTALLRSLSLRPLRSLFDVATATRMERGPTRRPLSANAWRASLARKNSMNPCGDSPPLPFSTQRTIVPKLSKSACRSRTPNGGGGKQPT